MKYRYMFFYFYSCLACADPFYTNEEKQAENSEDTFENHTHFLPACTITKETKDINLTIPFHQLTLIGIINIKGKYKALFRDEQRKIYDITVNDYLPNGHVQIIDIDLKTVSYIDWQKNEDCQNPTIIKIKL